MNKKLNRSEIKRRFGKAAVLLQDNRQQAPFRLEDFQAALDEAGLPVTATTNHPVVRGLFFWAYCPSHSGHALVHRSAAIDYVESVAVAA